MVHIQLVMKIKLVYIKLLNIKNNYNIALNLNINLFSGFNKDTKETILKAQIYKINLQNKEAKDNFLNQRILLNKDLKDINQNILSIKASIKKYEIRTKMLNRLKKINNIDDVSVIENQITNIKNKIKLKQKMIIKKSKQKYMEILGMKVNKKVIKEFNLLELMLQNINK